MRKKVFTERKKALTETEFFPSGTVITRCRAEEMPSLTGTAPSKVVQGRMLVDECGEMTFRPYDQTGEKRYSTLHQTQHGDLKLYPKSMIASFKFDSNMSVYEVVVALLNESVNVARWILDTSR